MDVQPLKSVWCVFYEGHLYAVFKTEAQAREVMEADPLLATHVWTWEDTHLYVLLSHRDDAIPDKKILWGWYEEREVKGG